MLARSTPLGISDRMSVPRSDPVRYSDRPTLEPAARWRAAVAVTVLHGLLIWAIIHGLPGRSMPDGEAPAAQVLRVYNVVAARPQPPPRPAQRPPEAAKAPPARRAQAKAMVAPKRPVNAPSRVVTAPVASSGSATDSGAAAAGAGSGAGGAGQGTGAGNSGAGTGGGLAQKAVKLSGDINSTRDYPPDPEGRRLGSSVIVVLTVLTDGRAGGCRVVRPSADPLADAATCRLAMQRFRFRPATDAAGKAVQSSFGWKQSWFKPGEAAR